MNRHFKVLRVNANLLVAWFRLDGSRRMRFTGMPEDARITDSWYDEARDEACFLIISQTFPHVEVGQNCQEINLQCEEVS